MSTSAPDPMHGPATAAAQRTSRRRPLPLPRPYERPDDEGLTSEHLALVATRALLSVTSRQEAADVLQTAIRDLGGAVVPARLAEFHPDAVAIDVSLGLGEPLLVVVAPLSVEAVALVPLLPALVQDAALAATRGEATQGAEHGLQVQRDDYEMALHEADPQAATAAMQAALRRGTTPERWIREVVVPTQHDVGARWYATTWSVADEHAATAVAEQVVSRLPRPEPRPQARRVVFACAEGEWHSFPARLAAELGAATGVHTEVLGASVSANRLARCLQASRPDLLALSCTSSSNLIGAWRSINVAHGVGIPVVVGGRAWGPDHRRAEALGADARTEDPATLAEIRPVPRAEPVTLPTETLLLDAPDEQVLQIACDRQAADVQQATTDIHRQHALGQMRSLARHAAVAVATGDPSVLAEQLDWLAGRPRSPRVIGSALGDACHYLSDAVDPEAPLAAQVLRDQADALRARLDQT